MVPAAERAGDRQAEQQHRHADAHHADERPGPPGRGEQQVEHRQHGHRGVEPVGDKLCLGIDQRDAEQHAAERQGQKPLPPHAEQPLAQRVGRAEPPTAAQRQHAAQQLHQQVAHRDGRPAVAAPPAQE